MAVEVSRAWLARRGPFLGGVVVCLVIAALLRPVPSAFKWRNGGDCVRYLNWSHAVMAQGLAAFPELVDEYRAKWVGFPPPTRWSYLLTAAGIERAWEAIGHPGDNYHPLVAISWVSGVLSLLPMALWLRRKVAAEAVLAALLLLAASPVARAMSHFPLPDSLQLCLGLWLFALTAEWLARPPPSRGLLLWIGAAAFLIVTSRESGLIAVIAAAAMVVFDWRTAKGPEHRLRPAPLYAMFGGCLVALICTIFLVGGPLKLALLACDVVYGALHTGNGAYVSGPFYRYLVDFMIVSPALVVTVLTAIAPLRRESDLRPSVDQVGIVSLTACGLYSLLPKTLRYVLVVDAGMRIVAALAVFALFRRGGKLRLYGVALFLLLLTFDEVLYASLWGNDQIYDALTFSMSRQLRMIP